MEKTNVATGRKKIPIVRITSKLFTEGFSDVAMDEFDNESIGNAKEEFIQMLVKGLPRNKINVRHTKEIVWIYEDEFNSKHE